MRLPKRPALCVLVLTAAGAVPARSHAPQSPVPTLFEGARLVAGDGAAPIENSAFIVEHDTFSSVGRKGQLRLPPGAARVDLTGKTVMPALTDDHVHIGYRKGLSFSAENYTRETLLDTLDRFAYAGIAAVLEAGTGRGILPFQVRDEARSLTLYRTAGRGFAMPNAGPGVPMRDAAYGVTTESGARSDVRELAASKPDIIKIWVDDRNGTVEKLKPNLYRAIIDEAHKHNIRVMAHIATLDDAKDVLRAGVDGLAHPVRDRDIDDELIAMLRERPNVFVLATLWSERRAFYGERPAWIDESLARDLLSPEEIAQLADSFAVTTPQAGPGRAREGAQVTLRNVRKLAASGVKLGLGTDTGGVSGGQYFGLASHVELELLVKAGIAPSQAIVAATSNAADILGLDRRGTIARGRVADFLVLDANPLDDVANSRKIAKVYLKGVELDRAGLKRRWTDRR